MNGTPNAPTSQPDLLGNFVVSKDLARFATCLITLPVCRPSSRASSEIHDGLPQRYIPGSSCLLHNSTDDLPASKRRLTGRRALKPGPRWRHSDASRSSIACSTHENQSYHDALSTCRSSVCLGGKAYDQVFCRLLVQAMLSNFWPWMQRPVTFENLGRKAKLFCCHRS